MPWQGDNVFLNCQGIAGKTVESLDAQWGDLDVSITVNGRDVDLPAFGFIDVPDAPGAGYVRMWNVSLQNLAEDLETVHCVVDFPEYGWDTTYLFTVSD